MALPSQESVSWLPALLDESTFPMTRQVFTTGLLADGAEQDMEFGLARIVAGIEDLSGAKAT